MVMDSEHTIDDRKIDRWTTGPGSGIARGDKNLGSRIRTFNASFIAIHFTQELNRPVLYTSERPTVFPPPTLTSAILR